VLTITEQDGGLDLTFTSPSQFANDVFSAFAEGTGTGITLSPAVTISPPAAATPGWMGANLGQPLTAALSFGRLEA
jgi:hypothetical protein